MNDTTKKQIAIVGCIGAALWLLLRRSTTQDQLIAQPGAASLMRPQPNTGEGQGWIPGSNNPSIIFGPGGNPIIFVGGDNSAPDININVPDLLLGALSRQYIPLFGFVGVQGVGAQ